MWCATYKYLSRAKAVVLTCVLLGRAAPSHHMDTARPTPGHCHQEKTGTGSYLTSNLYKMEVGEKR